ncbi:MAG: terminase small subunit [Bacteroidota bacterium]
MEAKKKRFCEEYVLDFIGSEAAIRAGYNPKRAKQHAYELMQEQEVKDYIEKLQDELSERSKITVDECVEILSKLARFDIAELYQEDGELKPIHEIDFDSRLSLEGVDVESRSSLGSEDEGFVRSTVKKVKLSNRKQAIDMLMKHLGGYREDNSQKQPNVTMLSLNPLTDESKTDNGTS